MHKKNKVPLIFTSADKEKYSGQITFSTPRFCVAFEK